MSKLDITVSNELVIPIIHKSELFTGHEDAPLAIGMLAIGDEPISGREDLFDAYLKLRAKVYATQTQMIPKECVRPDGTEMDGDDVRSVHWGIFEQGGKATNMVRAIGAIRVIKKTEEDDRPLPIEEFFSDAFQSPVPVGGTEVSRYISRHENPDVQRRLSPRLFGAVVSYVTAHELGPTYGVVEPVVERRLKALHVPMTRIAEPTFVPEYAADNLGFSVDIPAMAQGMGMASSEAKQRILETEQEITYFKLTAKAAVAS